MNTRAKFVVTEKLENQYNFKFTMSPVVSGSPENEAFFKTTPGGQLTIQVAKTLGELFVVNKSYYLDFTEA